ncbi:MAG: hypothetical protein OEX83_01185 [Gammaproteobacteria bacterium]|nr:hypothetical protein [Gammaproteobacteria bacterium]
MLHNHIKQLALLPLVLLLTSCDSNSLNSLQGPKSGKVSGLLCSKLEILTAARENPVIRNQLVSKGHCIDARNAMKVKVVRTVMMPSDGKYSQILWPKDDRKYWVRTEEMK